MAQITKEEFYESLEEATHKLYIKSLDYTEFGNEVSLKHLKGIGEYADLLFNMSVRNDESLAIYPLTPEGEEKLKRDMIDYPIHDIYNFIYKKEMFNLMLIIHD